MLGFSWKIHCTKNIHSFYETKIRYLLEIYKLEQF